MGRSHANYYRRFSLSRAIISNWSITMDSYRAIFCRWAFFFQLFYLDILIRIYIQVESEKFTPNQS